MDEWPLTGKYGHVHAWVDNAHRCMVINREVWTHTWIGRQYSWMNDHEQGSMDTYMDW